MYNISANIGDGALSHKIDLIRFVLYILRAFEDIQNCIIHSKVMAFFCWFGVRIPPPLATSEILTRIWKVPRFSKHRSSGPMLSISRNVRLFVRLFVHPSVCPSVCSLLRYHLNVIFPPLPQVGCTIFLEIRNPWGKVMEKNGLRLEHFCLEVV